VDTSAVDPVLARVRAGHTWGHRPKACL